MTEIKIEKGIPMPPRKRGRPSKYPWVEFEINESFFVPANGMPLNRVQQRMNPSRFVSFGRKFTSRQIPEEDGVRVWRIA